MRSHDVITLSELLERFIPFVSCCGYIETKCFISKCERFQCCHRIIWFEIPIRKPIGYTECMSCADVAVVPHRCINIREAFLRDCFRYGRIARSEEYGEELCSCDIVFCSISPISVSIGESLVLEIFDRFLIPRIFCIGKCSVAGL